MSKQGNPPSLKPAVINGQLRHVVSIGGKPFQAHSSLKTAMCALVTAMALSGCATMERHPIATWVAAGVIAGSIAASSSHRIEAPADDLCRAPLSCK